MITVAGYVGPYGTEPGYNLEISYELVDVGYSEPVTLSEARLFMRVEDIADEDDMITEMIISARQAFEAAAGRISVVAKTATLWFSNPEGMYPIPFGPVQSITALYDYEDNEILSTEYELIGSSYPKLKSPLQNFIKMEYTVGMTTVPYDIKDAILNQVYFLYENRGNDELTGLCEKCWKVAQRWSKYGFIA